MKGHGVLSKRLNSQERVFMAKWAQTSEANMKYQSTRGAEEELSTSEAINRGLASDGGLYMPSEWPVFKIGDFDGLDRLPDIACKLLTPFFSGDKLLAELPQICEEAFNFPVPIVDLEDKLSILELFHGPTAAFKDVGARFLSACMRRINEGAEKDLNILVATSGDTGGAVAAAFDAVPGINVVVLYPKGLVSPRQEHQLCCWSDNVTSLRVEGSFDHCQAMVKEAFADEGFNREFRLTSANSISIGRLLPQMTYYAMASLLHYRKKNLPVSFVIPTGNVGNSLACLWARKVGMPIADIVLATNSNKTIVDYLDSGDWQPRASKATLASAMDVGAPSNMERLRNMFPEMDEIRQAVSAQSVSDDEIRQEIVAVFGKYKMPVCPHTATAFRVYAQLTEKQKDQDWILVATAHPAKFETIVEPLLGQAVDLPPALAEILNMPARRKDIGATLAELRQAMQER